MKRTLLSLLAILLFDFCLFAQKADYYRNHYVVVVDQGSCQEHANMQGLCASLISLFETGQKPAGLNTSSVLNNFEPFNPDVDQVTLYYSVISGEDYFALRDMCNDNTQSPIKVVKELQNRFITRVSDYQSKNDTTPLTLTNYLNNDLMRLMSKQISIPRRDKCQGLNQYIDCLILPDIDKTKPAERYIIIAVSNFAGHGVQKNIHKEQLEPTLANKPRIIRKFDDYKADLEKPFYKVPVFEFSMPVTSNSVNSYSNNTANNPVALGNSLELRSLQHKAFKTSRQPRISQKEYKKTDFNVSSSSIDFNHDSNLEIYKIVMEFGGNQFDTSVTRVIADNSVTVLSCFDAEKSIYNIEEFSQSFPELREVKKDDTLNIKYIFYARSINDSSIIPPMVFTTDLQYVFSEGDIASLPIINEDNPTSSILMLIGLVLLIAALLTWLYISRGKKRRATVKFEILPISNVKYMNVENKKVDSYDCWYMSKERTEKTIYVEGRLSVEDVKFAKQYKYRLEFQAEDIDADDDFTFRPDGKVADGNLKQLKQWYHVDVDKDNKFLIPVNAYLDVNKHPELKNVNFEEFFLKPHYLSLKVKFRILLLSHTNKNIQISEQEEKSAKRIIECIDDANLVGTYRFVVKSEFERKNAWISFDPGTTGSCSAIGFGGLPDDLNNIEVAMNTISVSAVNSNSKQIQTPIFPSKVAITNRSRIFSNPAAFTENGWVVNVEQLKEGKDNDFAFGNYPNNHILPNTFQSIKKMLGYTTPLKINKDGAVYNMYGRDLAHLLVRGLYKYVAEYVDNFAEETFKRQFYDSHTNQFSPRRAIVAVPNNYTMTKVQEMVDSVKRLNKFEEVHYLFESEAVMMCYCRKEWKKLENGNKIYVVFDMGGATINATAYTLKIKYREGNIDRLNVDTISKVGYCVGGDDIDYAIIKSFYKMGALSKKVSGEKKIAEHMQKNKSKLIKLATDFKLDYIKSKQKQKTLFIDNDSSFYTFVEAKFKDMDVVFDVLPEDEAESKKQISLCIKQFNEELENNLETFVYSKIEDAINELFVTIKESKCELIFSGRSTLFPGVCERVFTTLNTRHVTHNDWDGFNNAKGFLDADMVKSAVAIGGCWYALFSKHVKLDHTVIPFSIGYIDYENSEQKYIPLIDRNEHFNEYGVIEGSNKPSAVLEHVKFVQMLGSDYQSILRDYNTDAASQNKHKMNILDEVCSEIISDKIHQIVVRYDDQNNFTYTIKTSEDITPATNKYSRLNANDRIAVEIKDENNESFIFAALRDENENVSDSSNDNGKSESISNVISSVGNTRGRKRM